MVVPHETFATERECDADAEAEKEYCEIKDIHRGLSVECKSSFSDARVELA